MNKLTAPTPGETCDVTAVLTCFNHQAYVEQCLESVAAQTRPARQVIVIDDFSVDQSSEVIERWIADNQPNWTFIRHKKNVGLCASLNEALAIAEGGYFCHLATDDWNEPDRFERQVAALDSADPCVALVVGDIREVGAGGDTLVEHDFKPRLTALLELGQQDRIVPNLLVENAIPAPGVMMRTELIREVGGYDESLAFEDYDMWLRLAGRHSIAYEPGIVSNYRVVRTGMTRNASQRAVVLHSEAQMLAKHVGLSDEDDRVIASRLLQIAGTVLDLKSGPVLREILRLAAPVARARWIRGAIRMSRFPGGLDRIRRDYAAQLGVSAVRAKRRLRESSGSH